MQSKENHMENALTEVAGETTAAISNKNTRPAIPREHLRDPIRYLNRRSRRQAGASVLVEWSLALLLGGIVSAAAYAMFGGNSTDARTSNFTSELTTVVGKVSTNYTGRYDTVSTAAVIQNGYFSNTQTMIVTGNTINIKPGNGTLTIAPGTLTNTNDSVSWTFTNIPEGGCADAVSVVGPMSGAITVNGAVVKSTSQTFDPSAINCTNASNSINFLTS